MAPRSSAGAAEDVTTVLPVLPEVPTVVLSSQDVYQAYTGLHTGRCEAPTPGDPQLRVAASVRWHLANPPDADWTDDDARTDDDALSAT